ncbi:MFS transporter [Chryseobacterium arthrosphaerae]|uniref:MFS transporter n=1 Tax=Chryseobacterium arthrosphaerae TaxID=651561 RepID=A0A3S0N5G5_9FLAO|nr:MFS transporter [Chryseobacterium arthrosphaerae]
MKLINLYTSSFKGLSQESWMLALVMLINRAGSMVLPFLGVYMTNHLHFSIENSGIVLSFFGIGSVIGSWLGGMITDKIGEYRVQSLSLLLSVPLFCLIPLFTTEAGLAGIILAQSIVSETFRPANSVAITKYAKPENITRAFSLNRMAVNLGFSIGPALGGSYLLFLMNSYFHQCFSGSIGWFNVHLVFKGRTNGQNRKPKSKRGDRYKERGFTLQGQ